MLINGNWYKSEWSRVKPLAVNNFLGQIPSFEPTVSAKVMYDKENIYVIFQVLDCYVRSLMQEYNSAVSTDACVEFFFAPDDRYPDRYFNLEINAGGTPKMGFHTYGQMEYQLVPPEDLKKINIAHSLPAIVDPEIVHPVTWTVEYRLPLSLLKKFCSVVMPEPGNFWKANFYKTASKSSNAHSITWSYIDTASSATKKTPSLGRFHQPQYFGQLNFMP